MPAHAGRRSRGTRPRAPGTRCHRMAWTGARGRRRLEGRRRARSVLQRPAVGSVAAGRGSWGPPCPVSTPAVAASPSATSTRIAGTPWPWRLRVPRVPWHSKPRSRDASAPRDGVGEIAAVPGRSFVPLDTLARPVSVLECARGMGDEASRMDAGARRSSLARRFRPRDRAGTSRPGRKRRSRRRSQPQPLGGAGALG